MRRLVFLFSALLCLTPAIAYSCQEYDDYIHFISEVDFASDSLYELCIHGSKAYMAAEDSGLVIVDVSNYLDLRQVGSLDSIRATSICVSGTIAVVCDNDFPDKTLYTVDVSNPSLPVVLGDLELPYAPLWGASVAAGE